MSNSKLFYLLIFVLIYPIYQVRAIYCVQCSSMVDLKCKDTSLLDHPKFCVSNETSCLKYSVISQNNEVEIVVRSCANVYIANTCEVKIIQGKFSAREMKVCYETCFYDGCNYSTQFKSSHFLIILLISLLVLIN